MENSVYDFSTSCAHHLQHTYLLTAMNANTSV